MTIENSNSTDKTSVPESELKRFEQFPRPIWAYFLRHGEPEEYAKRDALLSENGIRHLRESVAEEVMQKLAIGKEASPELVIFVHSPYIRTQQTSMILKEEIRRRVNPRLTRIVGSYPIEALSADDTLSPYMNVVPTEGAYFGWLAADPELERQVYLALPEDKKIRTRKMIADLTLAGIKHIDTLAHKKPGIPIKIVAPTHETTIGSLVHELYNTRLPIHYGGGITVFMGNKDGNIYFIDPRGIIHTQENQGIF